MQKMDIRMYHTLGAFLRNEYTNIPGKRNMIITPLLLSIYDLRAQLRKETYAKEWLEGGANIHDLIASDKIRLDKTIMIIYLPLIHISVLFITGGDKINVIPCQHQFITCETDYDPASIYFYRIASIDNAPVVLASCKYAFNYKDIIEMADDNITYSYLVASYVDMFENILEDIDMEYKIIYKLSPKNINYDN